MIHFILRTFFNTLRISFVNSNSIRNGYYKYKYKRIIILLIIDVFFIIINLPSNIYFENNILNIKNINLTPKMIIILRLFFLLKY